MSTWPNPIHHHSYNVQYKLQIQMPTDLYLYEIHIFLSY